MKMEIKNVTPALAKKLLDANEKNRKVSRDTVSGYARDMAAGKWQMNGAAIVIAKSGELLDGQHRLLACLESGVPFATYVCSDADENTRTTIDSGRSRSAGDRLQMNGVKNANLTAAAISILAIVAGDLASPGSHRPNLKKFSTRTPELLKAHIPALASNTAYRPL